MRWISAGFLLLVVTGTLVSLATDRAAYHPVRLLRSIAALRRSPFLAPDVVRRLRAYNKPGFHPDDPDNTELLERPSGAGARPCMKITPLLSWNCNLDGRPLTGDRQVRRTVHTPDLVHPLGSGHRTEEEVEVAGTAVDEVMAELAALEDPKVRAVNERHGDDHGVNLGKLRALAKRLKTQQDLARGLWGTGDGAARLLALLICRPKAFERDELDTMMREARTPKVQDWLVNYVVKKSPHAEDLRLAWFADPDPVVAAAGWALTAERVVKKPEGLDLAGLLDVIEAEMKDAPDRLQWAMNTCLAEIGIEHGEHRARAIGIGERLEVLKDYPTSPGCTSPFAPIWIDEMVRRQGGTSPAAR
ncbi:hypothetical protein ACTIVE_1655 [Actinomadura verrucosospora]|uniref:DNA alkylation repair protein n=2 Tax=Actinomadura verrucosospora TaxID=46165 RepID=A0A7D3VQX0_ACTVE|nr:hypothetical protein ACTIVE_1655 [Actinomadura verrucosospora]